MNPTHPTHLDNLARRLAQATSRRGSLLTISGTGLAAIAGLSSGAAGKKSKKRKKGKNKADKKCRKQEDQCNAFFQPLCAEERAPEDCTERLGECCELLGACQAAAYNECLFAIIRPPVPV